ncbi:hypothetical protein DFJ67_8205 [Asanoa ferruginea]|uniref:Uncharacterized protein n=1 Tax=Asanoa ferruginea TaxID=53367 RepID=A0A3D9ZZP1_9ACTN|nr:hypothetical protein [Asanoa ferruginea]REG02113.1 hypothetical protein DFJ67_8205 [Asanoa ferruginea]GIF48591.1 hypothetical protein Afe04nite_31300 [Asanoa ferruginea]
MHKLTHRIPLVPPHEDKQPGHQGSEPALRGPSWNHSPGRPPRVLAAWQRRIAALFGQRV